VPAVALFAPPGGVTAADTGGGETETEDANFGDGPEDPAAESKAAKAAAKAAKEVEAAKARAEAAKESEF